MQVLLSWGSIGIMRYIQSLLALGSASIKITSICTMHISLISGNLNELEDPTAGRKNDEVNCGLGYSHTK